MSARGSHIRMTTRDVQGFIETARSTLARSAQQVARLRRAFPAVTTADVLAMEQRIRTDPAVGSRPEQINVAAYFLALHKLAYERAQCDTEELGSSATSEALHQLLQALLGCADYVNALTLLQAGGGLVKQEHLEEFLHTARSNIARTAAATAHAPTNDAKAWVQQQWKDHGHTYRSKAAFGRKYVDEIQRKYGIPITEKTIIQVWLSPSAL